MNFSQHRVQQLLDFLFQTRSTPSLRRAACVERVCQMIVNAPRLLAIALVQCVVHSSAADTSDCRDALQKHRTAHVAVVGASRDYARCVRSNDWNEYWSP